MKNQDIITDATHMTKVDFKTYGLNLLTGCASTNSNFTFPGTIYTLYVSRYNAWVLKNSEGEVTGDHVIIQTADDNLLLAKASYSLVATSVNSQSSHDLIKLKSSGGILTSEGGALGVLPKALIKSVTSSVVEEATISIETYDKSVGTMVYWTDLTASTPQQNEFFAQKHIIHLDGLISGHQYEIIVAHKGSVRKVILSNPVKIYIQ